MNGTRRNSGACPGTDLAVTVTWSSLRFPAAHPTILGRTRDARDDAARTSRSVAPRPGSHVRGAVHGGRNALARHRGQPHRRAALRGPQPRTALSHRPTPAGPGTASRLGSRPEPRRTAHPHLATRPTIAPCRTATPPRRLARWSRTTRPTAP